MDELLFGMADELSASYHDAETARATADRCARQGDATLAAALYVLAARYEADRERVAADLRRSRALMNVSGGS